MPGDLVTLEALKLQMELDTAGADETLAALITAASSTIREWTGREYVGPDDPEVRVVPVRGFVGTYGVPIGDLRSADGLEVAVLDADGDEVATLTPADDVTLLPLTREPWKPYTRVRLRSAVAGELRGDGALRVGGLWGWPAVPEYVQRACIVTVRSWFRRAPSEWEGVVETEDGRLLAPTPPSGWMLPTAARQLLTRDRIRGIAGA